MIRTILFLVILLDKIVSVDKKVFGLRRSPFNSLGEGFAKSKGRDCAGSESDCVGDPVGARGDIALNND